MRALEYSFRQGAASVWRNRGAGAFAVLAIALAMIVLGSLLLITWNAEQVLARWMANAEISVYLQGEATSEQRGAIEAMIDESRASAAREYISKAQALTRFRREFVDLAALAEGFQDNPFPASIEVRLVGGAGSDGRADALVRQIVTQPGVADVRYDQDWLGRIDGGVQAFRRAGLALAVLMAVAAAVTVAAVVRLSLHARRDELEIMELVGAPLTYIRGPLVAEGLLQGGAGAFLALGALWLGLAAGRAWWDVGLRAMLDGETLRFLPVRVCLYLVLGGMGVGGVGGFLAARRVDQA